MGRDYKKWDIWNKGMEIVRKVYLLTKKFPKEEVYGLVSQMRRAAVSIPSNVAEGSGRNYDKEFKQFLYVSLGSSSELETQILLSKDLGLVNNDDIIDILDDLDHFKRMTSNFIKNLE